MADHHVCKSATVSAHKMQKLLDQRNCTMAVDFKCGSCSETFKTLCVLHFHLMECSNTDSYFFNSATRTMIPRWDTVSKCTQIDGDLLDIELRNEVEPGDIFISSARENNLPACDRNDEVPNGGDSINHTTTLGKQPIISDVLAEASFGTLQEENGDGQEGKLTTKEETDNPVITEGLGNLDSKDADCETCLVKIRNVQQLHDGTISFEIDEKNANLFDVTASAIVERLRSEGINWIGEDEIQMTVPVKKGELKTDARNDSTEKDVVSEGKNIMSEKNITTERNKLDVKKAKLCRRQRISKSEQFDDGLLEECLESVIKLKDVPDNSNPNFGTQLIENIGGEIENLTFNNRRSSRKRTVSSRLKDAIWDSPLKQKYQKHLSEEFAKGKKIRVKGDNSKQESEAMEDHDEIENIQITGTRSPTQMKEQTIELSGDTIDDRVNDVDINTENTCQADISASEVLLSLSKGNNQQTGFKEHNHQIHESQVSKTEATNRRRRSRTSKYKSDTGDSDDDFSDEEVQRKSRKKGPTNKRKDYECPTCGKVGTLAMIKYHEQCHSKEKLFTCEVCGKGYKTRPCLVAHKRLHGEWKFKCDQCPAKFYRKQYLTSHLLTHTGELPHVCTQCNKGFREAYILQRHINNVHKDIRNYPCDLCDRMFFRPETRDNHRVRHFEPTLQCSFCQKMFKAELDRRKHELTHTGEKQFFCPKCSGGFTQLWPYYRHMWKKHNIGKDEAKKIRIKNKDIVSMRNINRKANEPIDVTSEDVRPQTIQLYIEDVEAEENEDEKIQEPVNIVYGTKLISDFEEISETELKQEQIDVQNNEQVNQSNEEYVYQSNEEYVSQSNEELVNQSGEDVVIQSTSDVTQVAADLKGIYDHYYVPEGSNIVLTGKLDERTFMMETRNDTPDSEISIVQQNVVILSEYPAMEGTYAEIDGYTKEYSSLEI